MTAERVAKRFHELYEQLAPEHGYETRRESAVPWDRVPERNRELMVAVATTLLKEGTIEEGTEQNTESKSILQAWVTKLGLRHQGVLVTAMRGCDGLVKNDLSKPIMRAIRCVCLVPYDPREVVERLSFMHYDPSVFTEAVKEWSQNLDGYPLHFVLHVMHALEVIGYCHPEMDTRYRFIYGYNDLVRKLHLRPELRLDMEARLNEDRVSKS